MVFASHTRRLERRCACRLASLARIQDPLPFDSFLPLGHASVRSWSQSRYENVEDHELKEAGSAIPKMSSSACSLYSDSHSPRNSNSSVPAWESHTTRPSVCLLLSGIMPSCARSNRPTRHCGASCASGGPGDTDYTGEHFRCSWRLPPIKLDAKTGVPIVRTHVHVPGANDPAYGAQSNSGWTTPVLRPEDGGKASSETR